MNNSRWTFVIVQALATDRQMRLERGTPKRTLGAQSGYILWRKGLWTRYQTLQDVVNAIKKR